MNATAAGAAAAGRPWGRVDVLGVAVDAVSVEAAIDHLVARAADPGGPPGYVVKPYVEFLDRAARDAEIRELLAGAELCLADGVALQWAAAYLAGPPRLGRLASLLAAIVVRPGALTGVLPARVAGPSFTWPLLLRCASAGLRVHLIGSPRSQPIENTARHLEAAIPGLRISGVSPGRGDAGAEAALVGRLREERPDVVLVGMGFPLQERLMARLAPRLDHGMLIGEGGTFDYREFGGRTRRAPAPLRRAGLEWLWRLAREPARWRRQLAVPRFVWRVWHHSVTRSATTCQ